MGLLLVRWKRWSAILSMLGLLFQWNWSYFLNEQYSSSLEFVLLVQQPLCLYVVTWTTLTFKIFTIAKLSILCGYRWTYTVWIFSARPHADHWHFPEIWQLLSFRLIYRSNTIHLLYPSIAINLYGKPELFQFSSLPEQLVCFFPISVKTGKKILSVDGFHSITF